MIGILKPSSPAETPEEFVFMNFGQTTDSACEALDVYEIGRRNGIPDEENMAEIEDVYGIAPYVMNTVFVRNGV